MTADVKKFHANFGKNAIDGNLMLRSLMTDPFIQSAITANVDLSTLKDFVPMAEGESYSGLLDADINIKGKMSSLEKEDYESFTAEGNLLISEMIYKSPDLPNSVDITKMGFAFSPKNLSLTELKAKNRFIFVWRRAENVPTNIEISEQNNTAFCQKKIKS